MTEDKWILGHPQTPGYYWFAIYDYDAIVLRMVKLVKHNGVWEYHVPGWAQRMGLLYCSKVIKHIAIDEPIL